MSFLATDQPSASATPTPTVNPIAWKRDDFVMPALSPLPANLQKYKDMSLPEFGALPKVKQLRYASYFLQNEDLYSTRYSYINGTESAERLVPLNVHNGANELIMRSNYAKRIARSVGSEGGGSTYDLDDAKKILTAYHLDDDGTDGIFTKEMTVFDDYKGVRTVDDVAASQIIAEWVHQVGASALMTTTLEGQQIRYRKLDYRELVVTGRDKAADIDTDTVFSKKFYFIPFSDYLGKKSLAVVLGNGD